MLVVGKKEDGRPTENSPAYHGAGRAEDRIRLRVVRTLLCTLSRLQQRQDLVSGRNRHLARNRLDGDPSNLISFRHNHVPLPQNL